MLRTVVEARTLVAMMVAACVGTWGLRMHPVDHENLFLAFDRREGSDGLPCPHVRLRDHVVFDAVLRGVAGAVDAGDRCIQACPERQNASAPALPIPRASPLAVRRTWRGALSDYAWPRAFAGLADDPAARALHRHHDSRRRRYRQDVGLHVSVRRPASAMARPGSEAESRRARPGSERRLLQAGPHDARQGGTRRRLLGDRARIPAYCYNPLHNDLDPYAVAYAIASLFNNLFGKSQEPFWQQAYTDLLKFVISLRRISDGYTTLSEVYRYIINEAEIDKNIRALNAQFKQPPDVIAISRQDYEYELRDAPWTLWAPLDETTVAHPYDAALESHLVEHAIYFSVRTGPAALSADRRHRLEAIDRWFYSSWTPLDRKVKASIVEGVVVFLSLFDENPAVYRAFCPSREMYAKPPAKGQPRPLPPLDELLESGQVLALNFPVAMNPGLARALGVMLKLDFQRAVLQRIPKIAAQPNAVWRDLLFVSDEYHAFATVGETDPTGDERTFALSRQARLIPIVATQSISSLRSALPGDESWRTLLQCFRTKVFLATSDEFTAQLPRICADESTGSRRSTRSRSPAKARTSLCSPAAPRRRVKRSARARSTAWSRTTRFGLACSRNCRTRRPSCCRTTASIRCRRSTAT